MPAGESFPVQASQEHLLLYGVKTLVIRTFLRLLFSPWKTDQTFLQNQAYWITKCLLRLSRTIKLPSKLQIENFRLQRKASPKPAHLML
uniref:Uncharacterized protein n=1 Tax=Medicago truncatula TaxID=3880 RepID=I3SWZ3_MEDTR|nr:unknown [Medicago truncatula]